MCLVHIETVNTELLECHHIVFAGIILQFLESCFQRFSSLFKLLDRKTLCTAVLEFFDTVFDLCDLFRQKTFLPLFGHGYFLKLRVSDNDGIIVAGCDSCTELFAVLRLEIFLGCHKNIS